MADALFQLLVVLVVFALAMSIMLKPFAPGFANTLNQQLGNCTGRLITGIVGVLFAIFLVAYAFESCVAKLTGRPGPQLVAPSVQVPDNQVHSYPNLPAPPNVRDIHARLAFSPPVQPYTPGSYAGRGFGVRNRVKGLPEFHVGEDIDVVPGTPVFAAADGTVVYSGPGTGYGRVVVIEHRLAEGTRLLTIYGHLSGQTKWSYSDRSDWYPWLPTVSSRSRVRRGDLVGFAAEDHEDGGAFAPHLHMGLRILRSESGFEPDAKGWYKGYGEQHDLGRITPDGRYEGGSYVAFSELLQYGLGGMTTTVE